jgi:hypothetical protein
MKLQLGVLELDCGSLRSKSNGHSAMPQSAEAHLCHLRRINNIRVEVPPD